jgi:hypothetical protein
MKIIFEAHFDGLRATVDGLAIKFDGARPAGVPQYAATHPEEITLTSVTSSPWEVNSYGVAITGYIDEGQYCEVSVADCGVTFAVVTTKTSMMGLRLASGVQSGWAIHRHLFTLSELSLKICLSTEE